MFVNEATEPMCFGHGRLGSDAAKGVQFDDDLNEILLALLGFLDQPINIEGSERIRTASSSLSRRSSAAATISGEIAFL